MFKELKNIYGKVIFTSQEGCSCHRALVETAISQQVSLCKADLSRFDLRGITLSNQDLYKANLSYTNLNHARLSNVNLTKARLQDACLQYAKIHTCNLSHADLTAATLYRANVTGSEVCWANLSFTDLRHTIFTDVKFQEVIGNGKEIKTLHFDRWKVVFTRDILSIGCQQHEISRWLEFTDMEIACIDEGALTWWKKWKGVIFQVVDLSFGEER